MGDELTPIIGEEPPVVPFDIILPTHNRLDLTIRSINALYTNTANPFHLIVVDDSEDIETPFHMKLFNGNISDKVERKPELLAPLSELLDIPQDSLLRSLKNIQKHDNITYIHSEEPFTEGNQILNVGLEKATSEFIGTQTSSVVVEGGWETLALDFLRKHTQVGIVGLKLLLPWGPIESAGVQFHEFMPIDIGGNQSSNRFTSFYSCDAVCWALAIVRKEAVYPLPTGIYHGFRGMDDLDNCFVAKKGGWGVFYCGYGVGIHATRATRGSNKEKDIEDNLENRRIFAKRWGFLKEYEDVLKKKKAKGK